MTVETQFDYSVSNPAWLKSLILNENMLNVNSIATNTKLTALPEYPYSKTADSFKSDVEYYTQLYSLDVSSKRAAYIYVLEYLNSASAAVQGETSDEYIKEWLTDNGIIYPTNGLYDTENLIFARTLYSLMSGGYSGVTIPSGTTVQAALVMYMAVIFGDDIASMIAMNDGLMPETFDEYVYLVCLVALNANGYNVNRQTPENEIYRLTAVQMVRTAGYAVDADTVTFEELKNDFTAVWVGKVYDVNLDATEFAEATANGTGALYVIRTIGKTHGIAVQNDASYADAFTTVAENTDVFAFDTGEFYADIYNYEAYLSYIREKVWICPTALHTPEGDESILITVDGSPVETGEYKEIPLSTEAETQTVIITVTFTGDKTYTKNYTIKIHQGTATAPANENTLSGNSVLGVLAGNTVSYIASAIPIFGNALNASLLMPSIGYGTPKSIDVSSVISSALSNSYFGTTGNLSLTTENTGTLLVLAADPPEGYKFETDEKGYVIAIVKDVEEGATGDGGRTDVKVNGDSDVKLTFDMLKSKIPVFVIPAGVAVILLVCTFIFKKKE